ncbi:MAG: PEP-CTERM sorting domain-containing protein [Leptolyngbya sp. SIO4C1]|nr:PEP-CTERM sorting domain-containing protein [Leptolyngbya sp. SIO4C1]
MDFYQLPLAIGSATVLATISSLAAPADAFLITNTSSSWDNAVLSNGSIVGSQGLAAPSFSTEFLNVGRESQVRWGDGVYAPDFEWQEVTKAVEDIEVSSYKYAAGTGSNGWYWDYNQRDWDYGYLKTNKRYYQPTNYRLVEKTVTEQVKVSLPAYTAKSGLGFAGVENLNVGAGDFFNIGTLKHFNETIWLNGKDAKKVDFALNLNFADAALGAQTFDFALNIDETKNSQAVCPYQTDAGKGCSDKITWDFAIDSAKSFEYNGEAYTLELVGFTDQALSTQVINRSEFQSSGATFVEQFISQEDGTSATSLWARLIKVETPTEQVPEPTALLGLSALGLYVIKSRRDRSAFAS